MRLFLLIVCFHSIHCSQTTSHRPRKNAKLQKSEAQREKEKKRKEHAQKILQKHGGERKKQKTAAAESTSSAFQALFKQRAQGFEIAFKFRNAPPRPPVGPSFIGANLDDKLQEISLYKPLNAVEVNYRWKLHCEPDLGVPLAPSAMDPLSYKQNKPEETPLHPDDLKLLEWDGSLADTAAEQLKKRRDNARAAARLTLMGKSPAKFLQEKTKSVSKGTASRKKFSRVLDENMQSWMKKTTYITNDYSRKVHDFKSLAKTKQELEQDLEMRQQILMQRRSAPAVSRTFEDVKVPVHKHPSKKGLKPVAEMSFLPNVKKWGNAYTHVVVDKAPGNDNRFLNEAFVANVEKKDATARMTCQVFGKSENDAGSYNGMQNYELDVVPLKEEDAPHVNFCIWIDPTSNEALFTPISSRVQLSNGRPIRKMNYKMNVKRRPMNDDDRAEADERLAEVDADVDEKINGASRGGKSVGKSIDDGSDDDDHDASKMPTSNTIVAEG